MHGTLIIWMHNEWIEGKWLTKYKISMIETHTMIKYDDWMSVFVWIFMDVCVCMCVNRIILEFMWKCSND